VQVDASLVKAYVIPGKRSATRDPVEHTMRGNKSLVALDPRLREDDGKRKGFWPFVDLCFSGVKNCTSR